MQSAIITSIAKVKMLKARAGDIVLPVVSGFAFGDGGVNSSGEVMQPTQNQNSLNSELLRKPVDGHSFTNDVTCRYSCTLMESELAGEKISELALYDADGDLLAIKNFSPKGKDDDIEMAFYIDDIF